MEYYLICYLVGVVVFTFVYLEGITPVDFLASFLVALIWPLAFPVNLLRKLTR
jgi:hypothetical protein